MTELSEETKQFCKENYSKNCHRCVIRPECTAHVGNGREALDRWTKTVNDAASKVGTQAQLC
jgi:hypothetical protein